MFDLFWTPLSINHFVEIILIFLITVFFGFRLVNSWKKRVDRRNTTLLFFTFLSSCIAMVCQFLAFSLHADFVNYALPWVSPFASAAMAGFVLFAFFLNDTWVLRKWCGISLMAVLGGIVAFETFVSFWRVEQLALGYVEYRDAWTDIPFALGFLFAQALFFIQLLTAVAFDLKVAKSRALLLSLSALMKPGTRLSREAATARAFFFSTFAPIAIALVLLARSYGLIDWRIAEVAACWLLMVIYAGFTLIYLNYIPEYSSFIVKLVGLSLTALLCILTGISWLIGTVYTEAYKSSTPLENGTALRFEPQPDGSYLAMRTGFHFDTEFGQRVAWPNIPLKTGFEFPYFGKTYDEIFARPAGMVGFSHFPYWRDIEHRLGPQPAVFVLTAELRTAGPEGNSWAGPANESGLFYKSSGGLLTVTWNKLVSTFEPKDEYTFQLKLFPTGVIEMHYADLPDNPATDFYLSNTAPKLIGIVPPFEGRKTAELTFGSDLPFAANPGEGIVEYRRTEFREYLNRVYEPIALFILLSSLLVLIVFPLIFRINLDRPLKELIFGVRQIRNGKLATNISVFYRDEIGFLASSFNEMAAAQNALLGSLEEKVVERSAEASRYAAENARLEERNHLSQELHDAVSQTLFSANLIADTLPALMDKEPERGQTALAEMQRLNKDALAEMRQLLAALRQQKLSDQPFGSLLQEMVSGIEQKSAIKISLEIDGDLTMPEAVQLAFYRIAQESLANGVKHSGAHRISVYFDGIDDQALLVISDDGCGFDRDQKKRGHFGMEIMQERMASTNGTLEVETAPGKGTTITALWGRNNDG